ncbi:uncharacterized protein LOC143614552 [Bidens hawaiensis]|uniref:uncharacterized protein LOC143614552 n=1 Tax=Bidens hawaiensis TaxID=980011 RepID=UPI00404AB230
MESGDWRAQLPLDLRKRMTNDIMGFMMNELPLSEHGELWKMAQRAEDNIFTVATTLLEHIQNIRMIMLGAQSILQKSMAPPIRIPNAGDWLQEMYNKLKDLIDECGDWMDQLPTDSREKNRNKMYVPLFNTLFKNQKVCLCWLTWLSLNCLADTLKRHLPFSEHEGLKKTAVRIEDEVYTASTSQLEYLEKIRSSMQTLEIALQNPASNSTAESANPSYPGSRGMLQRRPFAMHVPSNTILHRRQTMLQGMHRKVGKQGQQYYVTKQQMIKGIEDLSLLDSMPDTTMESDDWKAQLHADIRESISNQLMAFLKRKLPFSGHEQLGKLPESVEEKMYNAAGSLVSWSEYLLNIRWSMLGMLIIIQNPSAAPFWFKTGSQSLRDWQEEMYHKLNALNDLGATDYGNIRSEY